jgi:hypothetical protein
MSMDKIEKKIKKKDKKKREQLKVWRLNLDKKI